MPLTAPTITPTVIIPPYAETVVRPVRLRVGAEVQRFGYALELLTEVELATHATVLASSPNAAGAYVVTGISALLQKAITIAADAGGLVITGTDATLLRTGALAGDTGSYSITGIAADLRPSTVTMAAEPGAFDVTGVSAGTLANRQASGETGAFAVVGIAADLVPPGSTRLALFPIQSLRLSETL